MTIGQTTDVLIFTVTKIETTSVFKAFGVAPNPQSIHGRVYFDLGVVNGTHVTLTQCEMGAGGIGASQQAVGKGITALCPHAVVMVGIAFGVNEEDQAIGDVLVAAQLRLYDLQRVGTASDGKPQLILRGDRAHASPMLLNLLRSSELTWTGTVQFGPLLTGEKLVDNVDFRDQLRNFEPEAIGGEMEGAGLYVACNDGKIDWILVKGICDFADGNKAANKKEHQGVAAANAAAFVRHAIAFVPIQWDTRHVARALVGRGGDGGSAKLVGNGIAIGGSGGRGGPQVDGQGGKGGGAELIGDGMAFGGDGGVAGQAGRGGRDAATSFIREDDAVTGAGPARPLTSQLAEAHSDTSSTAISKRDMRVIDDVLQMGSGYVLIFSDRTIAEFFLDEFGIDIDDDRYKANGPSKAKRLRTLLSSTEPPLVGQILERLLEERLLLDAGGVKPEILAHYRALAARLGGNKQSSGSSTGA